MVSPAVVVGPRLLHPLPSCLGCHVASRDSSILSQILHLRLYVKWVVSGGGMKQTPLKFLDEGSQIRPRMNQNLHRDPPPCQ